ncbi:MAG: SDR family oxidoreductase [Erythrobacter sp.]
MAYILVTGSSRGIGKAARALLQKRGVEVIGHGTRALDPQSIAADFSDPLAAQRLWDVVMERTRGDLVAVVNNAGLFEANPLDGSDLDWIDHWEDTLRINLTAAAQLSRFAVRHWQKNEAAVGDDGVRGRLVHVASRAAYRGDSPAHWHYAAAKGGLIAMHKTIARSYAADGILSYAVAPGFVDTAMAGDYLESRGGPGLLADIPLGRVATPDEIARIITFCALDAPASMTGAVIDANGASFVR